MKKYERYAQKPREFLSLTGYTHQEFEALLPHFEHKYYERMKAYRLDGKPRGKRRYSDYQNSPLPTIEDKLFFILHYVKTNNPQMVQGTMFEISQPKANQWIHTLEPVLNEALGDAGELPAREMDQVEFDETQPAIYFHDGTERPIPRPVEDERQRAYYSGKKNNTGSKTMC